MENNKLHTIEPPSRKSWWSRSMSVLILLSLIIGSYSLYKIITLEPGGKTEIAGVEISKPEKRFDTAFYDEEGNLIIKYTDGSTANAGKYTSGSSSSPAPAPTLNDFEPLVNQAIATFCSNGACKGDNPTKEEVVAIAIQVCSNNEQLCKGEKGDKGDNAPPITSEQIYQGWVTYCSTNNCKGEKGDDGDDGINGTDGRTLAKPRCVIRWDPELPGVTRYWEAWKYTDEPDSAYTDFKRIRSEDRTLYAEPCLDLRT